MDSPSYTALTISDTLSELVNEAKALETEQKPKNAAYKAEITAFINEIGKHRGADLKFSPETKEQLKPIVRAKVVWADGFFQEFEDKVDALEKRFKAIGEGENESLAALNDEFERMSNTHGYIARLGDKIGAFKRSHSPDVMDETL